LGHPISADTVGAKLAKLRFSRQFNRKADEDSHHPDRNAQFEHINAKVVAAQVRQHPRWAVSWAGLRLAAFLVGAQGEDFLVAENSV
jgi:pterin-4a-carbinolamine dehydratase